MRLATLTFAASMVLVGAVFTNPAGAYGSDGVFVYHMNAEDEDFLGRTTRDASGNGNDGTLGNVDLVEGRYGEAYRFSGYGDFIEVEDDVTSGKPEGTFAVWIKLDDVLHQHKVWIKNRPGVTTEMGVLVDTGGTVWFSTSQNGGSTRLDGTTLLRPDTWYHVAVTWGPEGKRIYLGGALDAEDDDVTGVGAASTRSMLGNDPNAFDRRGFWGVMDEVHFIERALSTAEIASLMGDDARSPREPLADESVSPPPLGAETPAVATPDVPAQRVGTPALAPVTVPVPPVSVERTCAPHGVLCVEPFGTDGSELGPTPGVPAQEVAVTPAVPGAHVAPSARVLVTAEDVRVLVDPHADGENTFGPEAVTVPAPVVGAVTVTVCATPCPVGVVPGSSVSGGLTVVLVVGDERVEETVPVTLLP